jgi:hypothetical protein
MGGGTGEKGPGGTATSRGGRLGGGMRGGRRRKREAAMEGQAVWRGTDALWVCDYAAAADGARRSATLSAVTVGRRRRT